jgi:predicted lipoprotein with Yx(FWY)xxD motif
MSRTQSVRLWSLGAVVALMIVAAACGSSSKTTQTATTSAAKATTTTAPATTSSTGAPTVSELAAVPAAAATGKTLSLAKGPKGIFLIGPNGHTLYIFSKDQGTTSACTGACLTAWPPLMSSSKPTTGPLVNAAQVSTANGQVTYYGHLLYYFKNDAAPGDTNGTTIPDWDLLGPFGNVMLPQG